MSRLNKVPNNFKERQKPDLTGGFYGRYHVLGVTDKTVHKKLGKGKYWRCYDIITEKEYDIRTDALYAYEKSYISTANAVKKIEEYRTNKKN